MVLSWVIVDLLMVSQPVRAVTVASASPVGGVAVLAEQQRDVISRLRIGDMELHRNFREKALLFLLREPAAGLKRDPIIPRFEGLFRP